MVTDAHGCTLTAAYTVTQPAAISITAVIKNVSCHGGSNGNINTTVSGGTAPYSYSWSNGSVIADPTGLSAGTYSVTVTDAKGCSNKASFTVTQPSALSVAISVTPIYNITGYPVAYTIFKIYGIQTDTLSATVTGGTPGYSYSWAPIFSSTSTLSVTTPAKTTTYSVTVTDALGCTAKDTQVIYVEEIRCVGDGLGKDHSTKHQCIYMCYLGKVISVDSIDVASYLALGATLDRCHGGHKEDGSGAEETIFGSDEITVYPNPNGGVFNVQIPAIHKTAEIQISDMTGRIIERRTITDNDGTPVQFSLGNVPVGMYFVKINAGDITQNEKIIKR